MKRRYSIALAIALPLGLAAVVLMGPWTSDPPLPGAKLSPADLREDVDFIHSLISAGVPTYGVFRDRTDLDARFAEAKAKLDRPMTSVEFWKLLAPAVTAVGDGHLSLSPSPNTFADPLFNRMIPLSVRFIGDRLFVRRNLSDADIPDGSEIVAVNGITPQEVLRGCSPYISRLPSIVTRVRERAARLFSDQCGLAVGLSAPYRVLFRPAQAAAANRPAEVTLPGIGNADFGAAYARKYPNELDDKPLELTLGRDRDAAVLAVRTFEDGDSFDFKTAIEAAFSKIAAAHTKTLILDLRDNPGGPDTHGALLYSLLTDKPFRYVERRDVAKGFRKVIWNSSDRLLILMELLVSKRRNESGGYRLDEPIDRSWQPHANPFTGRLFVLTNGTTFSTSSNVASVIKKYRRGILVGEETGSGYQEDSGATFDITLPHSGLTAVLPIVRYRLANDRNTPLTGVMPDVVIHPSVSDVLGKTDLTLSAALSHVQ